MDKDSDPDRHFDIISIGSATIDQFVYTDIQLIQIKSSSLAKELIAYPLGSKILVERFHFFTGGSASNTSVGFSRLGLKAGCISNIGLDYYGEIILKELKKEKVAFLGSTDKSHPTGFSVILDSFAKDRTILAYKGANDFLTSKPLSPSELTAKALYVGSLAGNAFNEGVKLIKSIKANSREHTTVFFNPSAYIADKGLPFLSKYLPLVDCLILNKEEARLLVENPHLSKPEDIITALYLRTKKPIAMTDGANGAFYYNGKSFHHKKARKIKVLESTGAGDAFSVGFCFGILSGKTPATCLAYGIKNSESVIRHIGAKNNLLKKSTILR
ncbi:MAG TPA: carbohydrate kinase family protein [Candidatus Woesearchaeota archaeon]|nr:carbohydrate kinase family protein [Candidatus Woesearchaeota archaeon]